MTLQLTVQIDMPRWWSVVDEWFEDGIFWDNIEQNGWPLRALNEVWLAQWAIENRMFRQGCIAE